MKEGISDFQTEEWNKIFRNLLSDIKNQQCILLLGSEIVKMKGQPLNKLLREKLVQTNSDDIAHYYEKDGFFLFKDKVSKVDIQREVKIFYDEHTIENGIETDIFRQIIEIPFHVVISINPDSYLSDISNQNGINHSFGYFQTNGSAVSEVEHPTKSLPLYYNLCGLKNYDDSLILDYDDLFKLMKAIFGAPGLPIQLKSALESAKTFICLGFDFNKWYSQLLLRLLSEKNGSSIKKYAINTDIADADTNTFLVHQFGITFLGEEHHFFQELYQRCSQNDGLRTLLPPSLSQVDQIKDQIKIGKIGIALQSMEKIMLGDDVLTTTVLLLSSQFHDLETKRLNGTMDSRDYFVRFNQIVDGILDTLNKIA
jgi:hypothetical protein